MISIALCDNDKTATPVIAGAARATFEARSFHTEVDTFTRSGTLLSALGKKPYDLVLLDLDMAGQDGIEVGKRIKSLDSTIPIVFVSACESRVFDTFPAQPLSFVRKNNFFVDIAAMVDLFQKRRELNQDIRRVELNTRTGAVTLRLGSIRYIESRHNYQMVYLREQKEPLEIKMTLERLEEMLTPLGFIRIHKSYLVNYRVIRCVNAKNCVLEDNTVLPLGRRKGREVRDRYLELLG